jgi:hypothetical protein
LILSNLPSPTMPGVNTIRPSSPATDGSHLWFLASGGTPATSCGGGGTTTEAYIYELDIQACNGALRGGALDCNGVETRVAGGALGHVDGIGAAARLQELRGTGSCLRTSSRIAPRTAV